MVFTLRKKRTTPAIRKYIGESQKSVPKLARELGLSESTVRKWRKRAEGYEENRRARPSRTSFTPDQQALIVEIRRSMLLSLDDLLAVVRMFIQPSCSRSSLDRLLRRHGVCRIADLVPDPEEHRRVLREYKSYLPGFMRVHERTLPRVQHEEFRKHLFMAVDRSSGWLFLEAREDGSPEEAAAFLRDLSDGAPFHLRRILTADRPLFRPAEEDPDPFGLACEELGVEHVTYPARTQESHQPLPDHAGTTASQPSSFASSEEIEKKLLAHAHVYNNHIPLMTMGRLTPVEKLARFHEAHPDLFKRHPGELAAYPDQEKYLFYQTKKEQPIIAGAEGIYMWDTRGKQYLDGCSGAVVNNIGHGNRRVIAAVERQSRQTFFAYRTQFENRPSQELARQLVEHSAPHLNRVFFVSGGSEAVESAMKVCRQYFFNLGEGSRYKFVSRVPAYHGSTLGALSLTSYAPLEVAFKPLVRDNPKIPAPTCYRCVYHKQYPDCELECAWALEKTVLEQGPDNIAAFVVEPVGGASTGALVPPDEYFGIIQHICRKYGIFLVLDEVMTGFGRTGKLFAYEHWGVQADVVALSKGIASGYYPLGAILTTDEIVDVVVRRGGFAHGHTYAGNPMACAVGQEVLRVIMEDKLPENADRMGKILLKGLNRLGRKHRFIGEVRGLGLLTALELVRDPQTREPFPPEWNAAMLLTDNAFADGLLIYPRRSINGLYGDHVLVAPPLIVREAQIAELLEKLDKALTRTADHLNALETTLAEERASGPTPATPYYR
ncbi:Adenosylmethionine-8-amino-7-oxononanoate aminotransferase [Paucidesulfovibrio gracilis DSM 16080]|uniref:Taurine--pyruvate aminotransferase n=1 Tax=Paucidesulfovibrio gracilis DSM 16080 TaxID=1121449 RepID=A0A1T4WAJ2_9BACT|nr:aminotransferase class III-fold pyridoxal phosphate-dependent enzyme [Paucidesulfovibrio gracilis]SKA74306.1 Adenosylmethionine-8-amino-7-oxononanoate aminotransferase [Paucidesulfovibrio gracilis DSM 16080]